MIVFQSIPPQAIVKILAKLTLDWQDLLFMVTWFFLGSCFCSKRCLLLPFFILLLPFGFFFSIFFNLKFLLVYDILLCHFVYGHLVFWFQHCFLHADRSKVLFWHRPTLEKQKNYAQLSLLHSQRCSYHLNNFRICTEGVDVWNMSHCPISSSSSF